MEFEPTDSQVHQNKVDFEGLETLGRALLVMLGQDPDRDGLRETPRRWAQWWRDFIEYKGGKTETLFDHEVRSGQLIVVRGMRVWSLCEHHLLPFWVDVTVGYVPRSKVLGLSKFARIAHQEAHNLQTQERLVDSIVTRLTKTLNHNDVVVLGEGQHLCMTMRGIQTPATMSTLVGRGVFDVTPRYRTGPPDPTSLNLFWDMVRGSK